MVAASVLGVLALWPVASYAQTIPVVSDGPDALPGAWRVPFAQPAPTLVAASGTAGYGYTESVLDGSDQHHRVQGSLAAAVRPLHWLGFGLRFDGRYDAHSTAQGADDGFVGDPRIFARAAGRIGSVLGLGLHLGLWAPGSGAPSIVPSAFTLDMVGFASVFLPRVPLALSLRAGFRADQSANAAPDAALYSRADRLALGLSSFHAVLLGVAVVGRFGPVEPMLEWTWDALVGANAPLGASPMHVVGGARVHLSRVVPVTLGLVLDVSPSARPSLNAGAPLVDVSPRVSALLSLAVAFPARPAAPAVAVVRRGAEGNGQGVSTRPAQGGVASGRVLDPSGRPVENAEVTLVRQGAPPTQARSRADGTWRVEGLPPGSYTLTVRTAVGAERTQELQVALGAEARGEVVIEAGSATQGVLRGQARAYDGAGVAVSVRVVELDRALTANANGSFSLDVDPGQYTLEFSAPGYEPQRRSARVERNGVVILNVDLRRSRGRSPH